MVSEAGHLEHSTCSQHFLGFQQFSSESSAAAVCIGCSSAALCCVELLTLSAMKLHLTVMANLNRVCCHLRLSLLSKFSSIVYRIGPVTDDLLNKIFFWLFDFRHKTLHCFCFLCGTLHLLRLLKCANEAVITFAFSLLNTEQYLGYSRCLMKTWGITKYSTKKQLTKRKKFRFSCCLCYSTLISFEKFLTIVRQRL